MTFQCSPRWYHMILPLWSHFLLLFLAYSWSFSLFLGHSTYILYTITSVPGMFLFTEAHILFHHAKYKLFQAKLRLRLDAQGSGARRRRPMGSIPIMRDACTPPQVHRLMLFRRNRLAISQLSSWQSSQDPCLLLCFSAVHRATQGPHQEPSECDHLNLD